MDGCVRTSENGGICDYLKQVWLILMGKMGPVQWGEPTSLLTRDVLWNLITHILTLCVRIHRAPMREIRFCSKLVICVRT